MGRRKIKLGGHKQKLRGRKATAQHDRMQRNFVGSQKAIERQARKLQLLSEKSKGVDSDGNPCFYCKLRLKEGRSGVEEYKKAMAAALIKWAGKKELTPIERITRNLDVRDFIQTQVDKGILEPVPCGEGDIPVAREYRNENGETVKVVAMAEGDPGVKPITL